MTQSVILWQGDCHDRLLELADESIDAFVCDPPYDLTQVSRKGSPRQNDPETPFGRTRLGSHDQVPKTVGFMNMVWDGLGVAFDPNLWSLVFQKLKPGGTVKAFGGTRTFHKMIRAMRQAGFVDLSLEGWGYGSGFPKSLNISKALDRQAKAERQIVGYKKGVGGENMNDIVHGREVRQTTDKGGKGVGAYGTGAKQVAVDVPITEPATDAAKQWEGYGTALKPAWEPIVVGRKP